MSEIVVRKNDRRETAAGESSAEPQYDVFVVYCQDDEQLANDICDVLEKEHLKCLADCKSNAFKPGQTIFDGVENNVRRCKRMLVIFTQNTLKSSWVLLETILAMEKSKHLNSMILRILTVDVSTKDMERLNRGLLADVPHITTDNSQADWKLKLCQEIKRDIPLKDILPVGSLAHGLVFSHFVGFLSYVLPQIRKAIENSKIYKGKPLQVSKKYHLLLPRTFVMINNLEGENTETGTKITKQETVEFVRHYVGKSRPVKLTIYKISRGDKEYYFYADCPNVLNALFTMSNEKLAPVDALFQMARFYYTMSDVINHAGNLECHDTLTFLLYRENDKWKSQHMCDELFAAIEEELSVEPKEQLDKFRSICTHTDIVHSSSISQTNQHEYDAFMCCFEDDAKAYEIQEVLSDYLKENGKTVHYDLPGQGELSEPPKAKWYIYIITEKALKDPNAYIMRCKSILAANISNNALNLLPVIVDLQPDALPSIIKWVTLVKASEPKYREKVLQTINGGVAMMEHRLPAGDVATGLAWAYVINYLRITLRDLKKRIEKLLVAKQVPCGCILKMFILCPKSCTVQPNLHEEANAGVNEKAVELVGEIEPVHEDTGGQLGRPFSLNMYKHTDTVTRDSVCFISEFCTTVHCMHEMANNYQFAGLTKEDMEKQCLAFVELLPEILRRQPVIDKYGDLSNLVEVVYYDDEKEKLLPALEKHIRTPGQPQVIPADNLVRGVETQSHVCQ